MAKSKQTADAVFDAALNYIKTNAAKLIICKAGASSVGPADYSEATTAVSSSGFKIASASISSADFTGPANGDVSGRKLTVGAQSSISVTSTGSADYIALVTASALIYTTTCTQQSLTASNLTNTAAWDIELADPT